MSKLILFTFLLVAILAVPAVNADTFVVAHGDPVNYYGTDAPYQNTTGSFKVWIFGTTKGVYDFSPMTTNLDQYEVVIPADKIDTLDTGEYTLYIQFPGQNHQFDITYEDETLKTIYKAIPDTDMSGAISSAIKKKFDEYLLTEPVDDVIVSRVLSVEDPSVRIKNMYTTEAGDLHMDLTTNLKTGDKITAMIDEDRYNVPEYRAIMSDVASVTDGESGRGFSLDFTNKASEQLPTGVHFITVRFLDDGQMVIPIERNSRYIPPTPTPVIEYYYDFSGNMIGYNINTTRPATAPTIAISTTVTPINWYQTVLDVERVSENNRTIEQRGYVYIGEKNLDIHRTLGWMSASNGNYYFFVQYCEYGDVANSTDDIIAIKDPNHFDVTPGIFSGKIGAWCQHQADFIEEHPPIAFFVMSPRSIYNPSTGELDISLTDFTTGTPPSGKNPPAKANVTPTEDPYNVYVTPTDIPTEPPTPVPIPTTESITLPLPAWLAVAALATGVVLFRR